MLKENREQIKILQDQVRQLQQQVRELQEQFFGIQQNQVQIDIHSNYPQQRNYGWIGGPFIGNGFAGGHKPHGGGDHYQEK